MTQTIKWSNQMTRLLFILYQFRDVTYGIIAYLRWVYTMMMTLFQHREPYPSRVLLAPLKSNDAVTHVENVLNSGYRDTWYLFRKDTKKSGKIYTWHIIEYIDDCKSFCFLDADERMSRSVLFLPETNVCLSRNNRVFPRVSACIPFPVVAERRIPTYVISNVNPFISKTTTSVANQVTRCHESDGACRRLFHSVDRLLVVGEAGLSLSRTSRSWFSSPWIVHVDKSTTLEITGSRRKRQIQNRKRSLESQSRWTYGKVFIWNSKHDWLMAKLPASRLCRTLPMWHIILYNDNGAMNNFILVNDG